MVLEPTTVYPETNEAFPADGTAVPEVGAVGAMFVVFLNNTYPFAKFVPLVKVVLTVMEEEPTLVNAPNATVPFGGLQLLSNAPIFGVDGLVF